MKVVQNQSFWREILDALPVWLMVFRIDENEEAHLIYANNETERYVGFQPEEWVLQVETESFYQNEIASLIDEVAELSKRENVKRGKIALTDRWGNAADYAFWFTLYKNKSQNSYQINVELIADSELVEGDVDSEVKSEDRKRRTSDQFSSDSFIAESDIMKAIVNQIPKWVEHHNHMLITGPAGAGKKTLAEKISRIPSLKNKNHYFIGDLWSKEERRSHIIWTEIAPDSVLLIDKVEQLDLETQRELLQKSKEMELRFLTTSTKEAQMLIERGALSPELYYELGFQSIPLPSLKKRPKDAEAYADRFIFLLSKLYQNEIKRSEEFKSYILNQDWSENFITLKELLRESAKEMKGNVLEIPIRRARQTFYNQEELFDQEKSGIEILSFDEMSRRYLKTVLAETDGKVYGDDGAAKLLDMPPTTLQSKLKKLSIK